MSKQPRITLAQLHVAAGDPVTNLERITQLVESQVTPCDLLVFPALALTGHVLQDRWHYPHVLTAVEGYLPRLCALSRQQSLLIGLPRRVKGQLFHSACLFHQGELVWSYDKRWLDNEQPQGETDYFTPGHSQPWFDFQGMRLAISLGNELEQPAMQQLLVSEPADLLLNLDATPYHHGSVSERFSQLANIARTLQLPLARVNPVGGQDELVFDGHSCVFDAAGELTGYATGFASTLLAVSPAAQPATPELPTANALTWQALVTAVRDYVAASRFSGAILGLSGGIDSALVLALAVDALGAERVTAVMLPYHYTSQTSLDDAAAQAAMLGVNYQVVPIAPLVEPFSTALTPLLEQWPTPAQDTTEQNLQARSRGLFLMALSNRSGALLLTNSNKSEMAVGYCTLYGDMAGGFAPLKDIPKTLVYQLAEYRNTISPAIPERVITRPPTAELAPDQEDSDSLPPYPLLDEIIRLYVEENHSLEQLLAAGLDEDWTRRMLRLIDLNEFKRRQAAPGPRMSKRGFGRERRMPLGGAVVGLWRDKSNTHTTR